MFGIPVLCLVGILWAGSAVFKKSSIFRSLAPSIEAGLHPVMARIGISSWALVGR